MKNKTVFIFGSGYVGLPLAFVIDHRLRITEQITHYRLPITHHRLPITYTHHASRITHHALPITHYTSPKRTNWNIMNAMPRVIPMCPNTNMV
ncbi:MAG: hypothetical protein GQ523_00945 [Methanophagales archaeon]|nr:hypothetical protein [Methanophagales archaeon]